MLSQGTFELFHSIKNILFFFIKYCVYAVSVYSLK